MLSENFSRNMKELRPESTRGNDEINGCNASNITGPQKFPFEIIPLESGINSELLKYFYGERTGFVQVGPEKYFFPNKYALEAENYYNFQARTDDIWVASFPRSGTTWTQELVWLIANQLDFETAKKKLLGERFPFFEFPVFVHPEIKSELLEQNRYDKYKIEFIENISKPGYEALSKIPSTSRRFIKTHFPFSLLPPSVMEKKCKIIYIARHPKDVAVSFYHLNRLFRTQGYVGDFKRYWTYFERGLNPWLPYFSHLKEALALQNLSNLLFLRYDDLVNDLGGTIEKIAKFLDCQISPEGIENLINHLNINNFRKNPSVNGHELEEVGITKSGEAGFIRKGINRGTQKEFVDFPELNEKCERWIQENGSFINEIFTKTNK